MKKKLLAKALNRLRLLPILSVIRTKFIKEVRILAYHRVMDINQNGKYLFDQELVSASIEDFECQVAFLKKYYNPITFSSLLDSMNGGKKMPERPVIITFDDGFEDNYSNAFPILKKYGVPATIFISTGYIGQNKLFWFEWVTYLIKSMDPSTIYLEDLKLNLEIRGNLFERAALVSNVLERLKLIPDVVRIKTIESLQRQAKVFRPSDGFQESRALSWEEVREMSVNGIEFGSHTVNHPILSNLEDDVLWKELLESKEEIEKKLSKPCQAIAYPVGNEKCYDDRVISFLKKVGYDIGVSYESGTNLIHKIDQYKLRRLHVERYCTLDDIASMLVSPNIMGKT